LVECLEVQITGLLKMLLLILLVDYSRIVVTLLVLLVLLMGILLNLRLIVSREQSFLG
jgi:hypothetical protein